MSVPSSWRPRSQIRNSSKDSSDSSAQMGSFWGCSADASLVTRRILSEEKKIRYRDLILTKYIGP